MASISQQNPNARSEETPSFSLALPQLLVLAVTVALGFTMVGSFSTVQEAAKAELNLSDYSLSLVQGLSAAIPIVLLSIPVGRLVDRVNRVRLLIVLAVFWTAGTFLTAVAQDFVVLFIARMITSFGLACGLLPCVSLAADFSNPARRGSATLIVLLGKPSGQAIGFALLGFLSVFFAVRGLPWGFEHIAPWRSAHLALGVISAIGIIPLLFISEPPRHESAAGVGASIGMVVREMWGYRKFLAAIYLGQVCVFTADAAALIWAAPVLTRSYELQPAEFAGWMGSLLFITGVLGCFIGGIGADMGHKTGRGGGVLYAGVAAALIGVPAALFPVAPTVVLFAVALGTLVFCGIVTNIAVATSVTVLLPNEIRGLTLGSYHTIAGAISFGIAPTLIAATSTLLGGEERLGEALALAGIVISALGVVGFLLAVRYAPRAAR